MLSVVSTGATDRNERAQEYLELLQALSCELERAMHAISMDALLDFEESVANQQQLSTRISELARELSVPLRGKSEPTESPVSADLSLQIRAAAGVLQTLNRRYSALLQHSSRSVAMMISLFSSFQGQYQEATGARSKHQTWSCQI